MSAKTGIQWTDATWNPVVGCTRVSPGCANCYAKELHDMRHRAVLAGKAVAPQYAVPFEKVQIKPDRLTVPISWKQPKRIFVNSVSDLFHDDVPDEYIARVFGVMALADWHAYQVLTKRPARMQALLSSATFSDAVLDAAGEFWPRMRRDSYEDWCAWINDGDHWPLCNVWLGVSVENQRLADERIPLLLHTPAAVRFLSCEPLLGPLDIAQYFDPTWLARNGAVAIECEHGYDVCPTCDAKGPRIDWVIGGGESGQEARAMHPDWVRALRDQCRSAGVAFFFKQWGVYREYDVGPEPQQTFTGTAEADMLTERAVNPAWLDIRGNLFSDPDNLPVETPCRLLERVGTKKSGRVLDGRTWDEFPPVQS